MPARYALSADPAQEHADPRRLQSRARLIDAATALLEAGGIEAVTVDAVTRKSKVARTTLYRHFDNSTQLLVAAFERLLPRVVAPEPTGSLQEQLTELVTRQARLIAEMPIQLTALAWIAMGNARPGDGASAADERGLGPLRAHVVSQYRVPFDEILRTPEARRQLAGVDADLAIAQLVGPVAFAVMAGLPPIGPEGCVRIVDDFFVAQRARRVAADS